MLSDSSHEIRQQAESALAEFLQEIKNAPVSACWGLEGLCLKSCLLFARKFRFCEAYFVLVGLVRRLWTYGRDSGAESWVSR